MKTVKIKVTAETIVDENGIVVEPGIKGPVDPVIEITDKDGIIKSGIIISTAMLIANEILSTAISYSGEFEGEGIITKQMFAIEALEEMKKEIGKSLFVKDRLFGRTYENEDN